MAYIGTLDAHAAYPRETNEFCAVNITDTTTGNPVTTGLTVCTVADGTRPATFIATTTSAGKQGITITGYTPGAYRVFVKVTASPFVAEVDCGTFTIS